MPYHEEEAHGLSKCVIYARVSSVKQKTQGHGLDSQITRCAEYAARKGYDVVKVFQEDISGKLVERPAMCEMIQFLKKRSKSPHVVIIDDISRLARDIGTHVQLRADISRAGGVLESPNMQFGNDSDSQFMENIMAAFSQHDRVKNAERTRNRMRARNQNGYWCFTAPVGYKYETVEGHGKMLVLQEPLASVVKEGIEGYASGRFETLGELKYFFERYEFFPKNKNGSVHYTKLHKILNSALYAGQINVPKWEMYNIKAKHEALISFETFCRIRDRLNGNKKVAPIRKNSDAEFPLRGFIQCSSCGKSLTACWSKGRSKHYPYYVCMTRGCDLKGKSIARNVMENDFEELLAGMTPSKAMFKTAHNILQKLWEKRLAAHKRQGQALVVQRENCEKKKDQLLERIIEADSPSIISAYETKIKDLEKQRLILSEKIEKSGEPTYTFTQLYRTAMAFLSNPLKLWRSGDFAQQRLVLKLTFADRLTYVKNEGYRTPKTTLTFKALAGVLGGECVLVGPEGLEPPT